MTTKSSGDMDWRGVFSHEGPPLDRWLALEASRPAWKGVSGEGVEGVFGLHFDGLPADVRPNASFAIYNRRAEPSMHLCNDAIRDDLAGGADGVWLECGLERGCRLLTAGDLDAVLEGVDLATTPLQLESDEPLAVGAFLLALAKSRDVDPSTLSGGLGADPLGSLAATGRLAGGLRAGLFELCAVAQLSDGSEGLKPVLVSTRAYEAAGIEPAEEVAWAIATGLCYVKALCAAGYSTSQAASKIRFSTVVSPRVFDGIAKLRALRLAWAKVLSACGVGDASVSLHAESSLRTRTQRDPHSNLLRGTSEAFAAIVGGAESVSCAPFDATYVSSDSFGRRMARNIPLLLSREAHLGEVADPAGGSYLLESLTGAYARAAWDAFRAIEAEGGMDAAVRKGLLARSIDASKERAERRVRTREHAFVGASVFCLSHEEPLERKEPDWRAIEGELGEDFGRGNADERTAALAAVAQASVDRSAAACATAAADAVSLGVDAISLCAAMRDGEPELFVTPTPAVRRSSPWEELAAGLRRFAKRHGRAPSAVIAAFGSPLTHRNEVDFASDLLRAVGMAMNVIEFDAEVPTGSAWLEPYAQNGAELVLIAAAKDERKRIVDASADAFKGAGAKLVGVVGPLHDHGADLLLTAGEDVLTPLAAAMATLGVRRRGAS